MSYGQGSIKRRGKVWQVVFYHHGQRFRKTLSTRAEALAVLKQRQGEAAQGRVVTPVAERLVLRDLIEAVEADYAVRERKSKPPVTRLVEHFGEDYLVLDLDYLTLMKYRAKRKGQGAKVNTINNEVSVIGHGLTVLYKARLLPQRPPTPWVKSANVRRGFVEQRDFDRLLQHLVDPLKAFATLAFYTGWRKSELTGLEWRRVSFERGEMWLDTSKNGESRSFPFSAHARVEAVLREQRKRVERIQHVRGFLVPSVLVYDSGLPMCGWYGSAWSTATRAAGLDGLLVHDLRRSAVRNLTRAGVPQSVAMKITGHKTPSMFRRYDIASDDDVREAVTKVAQYQGGEATGRVLPLPKRRAKA